MSIRETIKKKSNPFFWQVLEPAMAKYNETAKFQ
jgi:hypothetical protein